MNFVESVTKCFTKYADFSGTAGRPEYWWFFLFLFGVSLVLRFISPTLSMIFSLATIVPSLAAGARRLHDTDRSGWLQLIALIPVLGWIALIYFLAQEGKANRYGTPGVLPA